MLGVIEGISSYLLSQFRLFIGWLLNGKKRQTPKMMFVYVLRIRNANPFYITKSIWYQIGLGVGRQLRGHGNRLDRSGVDFGPYASFLQFGQSISS